MYNGEEVVGVVGMRGCSLIAKFLVNKEKQSRE